MKLLFVLFCTFLSQIIFAKTFPKVLVVNTKSASVSLVDLDNGNVERTIEVGQTPFGIALNKDNSILAVGVESEERVKFYKTSDYSQIGEVKIGKMHNDHLTLSPDGKYFLLANFYSDALVYIDSEKLKEVHRLPALSAPHVVKFGPKQEKAYLTCKKVVGISVADINKREVQNFQLNVNPRSLTFNDDETKIYFASFWIDGFFEMDIQSGKVTRLIKLDAPKKDKGPKEVTYHGVESMGKGLILTANEGRSFIDLVNAEKGTLLDRSLEFSSPCCVEKLPESSFALVSNIGNKTVTLVKVEKNKIKVQKTIKVGDVPKRVAFFKE